jgi:isoquinoline 1-oxidoreductase subunit beta
MNARVPNLSRRQFIVGTSAITTGLAIGLEFPGVIGTAHAQAADKASAPEIGVWVVIQPNDTVVIRVVHYYRLSPIGCRRARVRLEKNYH